MKKEFYRSPNQTHRRTISTVIPGTRILETKARGHLGHIYETNI